MKVVNKIKNRRLYYHLALGATVISSLPLITTISCATNDQTNDHHLSNPHGGILLNQKQQNSGLKVSAYANLFNVINPNTNKTYYPWDAKMTKTGFNLEQFQRNLRQVAPNFKVKINEDRAIQIADGHRQLSLLVFDPEIQSWQPAIISGFQSQIDLDLIKTAIITDVSFSELKWLENQLPFDPKLIKTINHQVIWRINLNMRPVLSQQLFNQGWMMEINPVDHSITFSDPVVKYQNGAWSQEVLIPAQNVVVRQIADPDPLPLIKIEDIKLRLRQILTNTLIDQPYSASALALLMEKQALDDWSPWLQVHQAQQEWFNALSNYHYGNQPLTITLSNPQSVSDWRQRLNATVTINHPQFATLKPDKINFNTQSSIDSERVGFQWVFNQDEGFVNNLMKEIIKANPTYQQILLQWFNQNEPQKWQPLNFVISSVWLNGMPPKWFNNPLDQNLANEIMTTHPQSQLFIDFDHLEKPTELINNHDQDLINLNSNQFNFANQSLKLINQPLTIINDLKFTVGFSFLNASIIRLNNFDKTLILRINGNATWQIQDPQVNERATAPLWIDIHLESWL